jgi:hypothetical protein
MSEYINNQSQRQERLKNIIRQLHAGKSVEDVKAEFAELLEDVGSDEIVKIEQALVEEGLSPEEITPLCDVHVSLFRESLDKEENPESIPGHPVFTYRAENLGVRRVLNEVREALEALKQNTSEETLEAARDALMNLRQYNVHYLRKENVLFPYLERHDFSGPSNVMWAAHDQIREQWKALDELLDQGPGEDKRAFAEEITATFEPLAHDIEEMIYKEENILFPAALKRLSEAEWVAVREQEDDIGYCYARPGRGWKPEIEEEEVEEATTPPAEVTVGEIPLNTGALTQAQLNLLFGSLPLDITFVDENDEVRFFSLSDDRIFQRSPAIIGRKVQNCHPPQSVDRVQQIIDDFRAGKRDVAEFWIQMGGKFIHIRYFALRDDEGTYRGTIEVTQDLAPLRELEGERRLLDEPKPA